MRFLVDENLSPALIGLLRSAGHDAVHVRDLDLKGASDSVILDRARAEDRVLISADTDFGELLARSGAVAPSVLLLRQGIGRRAEAQAHVILANLDPIAGDLASGAIVVLGENRVRVRQLPIRRSG